MRSNMRFDEFDDDFEDEDLRVCTDTLHNDTVDEAGGTADTPTDTDTKATGETKGRASKFWPSLNLEMDKNRAYETSHILVTTEDSYSGPERCFMLACIHCELYLNQKNISGGGRMPK